MQKATTPTRASRFPKLWEHNGWMVLFALGVGIAMLLTAVPLYLGPLRLGMARALFPRRFITIAYFCAYAACMAVFLLGKKPTGRMFSFCLPQVVAGTLGCAALVAARLVLNDIFVAWDSAGRVAPEPVSPLWVDLMRIAGAALSAYAASCALLSAFRLLERLSLRRAIIACVGSFLVLAVLVTFFAIVDNLMVTAVYALVPISAFWLLKVADRQVPYADLSLEADSHPAWRVSVRGSVLMHAAVVVLGIWALEFAGAHRSTEAAWSSDLASVLACAVFVAAGLCALARPEGSRPLEGNAFLGFVCRVVTPPLAVTVLTVNLPWDVESLVLDTFAPVLALPALLFCDAALWVADLHRGAAGARGRHALAAQQVAMCIAFVLCDMLYDLGLPALGKAKCSIALLGGALVLFVFLLSRPAASADASEARRGEAEGRAPAPSGRQASSRLTDAPAGAAAHAAPGSPWAETIIAHGLTAREGEVFCLLMDSLNAQDISLALGVSKSTVNTHIQHIYLKFDAHSYKELVRLVRSDAPDPAAAAQP